MTQVRKGRGVLPLPEVTTSFREDTESSLRWTIKTTGDPTMSSTNVDTHTMVVSPLDDEVSHLFRIRELVRSRISFKNSEQKESILKFIDYGVAVLDSAEEYRINLVTKKLGYNIDLIKDGSEKLLGVRLSKLGTVEAWNQTVLSSAKLIGSRAFNSFLSGVRSNNKEWASDLRKMSNELIENSGYHAKFIGATELDKVHLDDGEAIYIPYGFNYARLYSRIIAKYIKVPPLGDEQGDEAFKSDEFETGTNGQGLFAPLIIDKSNPLTETVKGFLHRKKKSSPAGKRLLYPDRLLTDPHRRVFGSKVRANGGIVLIDTSGSMHLTEDDIESILDAAPGALVMAYSHDPGSSNKANLFILADRGKRVKHVNDSHYNNGGNGVDGPALEYAISKRKGNEPIVWVCDGYITDSSDQGRSILVKQCAELVKQHKVIVIPSVEEAVDGFSNRKLVSNPEGPLSDFLK